MSSWMNLNHESHPKKDETVIIRLANGDQKRCQVTQAEVTERVFAFVFTYEQHLHHAYPDRWTERQVAMWKYPPPKPGNVLAEGSDSPTHDPINAKQHEPEFAEC